MTPEDRDEHRRQIIWGLEQQYQQAEAKALKAETDAAQAKREMQALEAARLRAQAPALLGDKCPACWITHGVKSNLVAVVHEDPANFDRLECKSCGYFEEIRND